MDVDISITCCMCRAEFKTSVKLPHGWSHLYRAMDDDLAFCDNHAAIEEWTDSQCPGCVGGWGDCSLWKSFAYRSLELSDSDFKSIESGICPKRTNGFFMLSYGPLQESDLSEKATTKSGLALSRAIREYVKKYHKA